MTNCVLFNYFFAEAVSAVTAATDGATATDQLLIVTTTGDSGLYYSALFYLFNKFTLVQLQDDTQSARQYDSTIHYNCKISRHNTALTDTLQEAQLSPSERAMRLVSSIILANYHATVQKLLIRQVLTKPMV